MNQYLTAKSTLIGTVSAVWGCVTCICCVDALARAAPKLLYLTCSIICNKNKWGL